MPPAAAVTNPNPERARRARTKPPGQAAQPPTGRQAQDDDDDEDNFEGGKSNLVANYCVFAHRFNGGPTREHDEHHNAALAVLGYLVQTRELGITYGGSLKVPLGLREHPPGFVEARDGLHTYHDSSWGTAPRPYGGYVVLRANGAVSVGARALKIVPDSTAEAKTAVASKAAKETVAMRSVSEDIGRGVTSATVLFGDNKAAYDIIVKAGLTARTRYFERVVGGVAPDDGLGRLTDGGGTPRIHLS